MAVVAKPFAVGDLVRWTSQARGVQRHRVGVVAAVVPAGGKPYAHLPAGRWRVMFRDNVTRPRLSYLVAIKGEGRGLGMLYHPHTGTVSAWNESGKPSDSMRRVRETIRRTAAVLEVSGVHVDLPADRALVAYAPRLSTRDRKILAVGGAVIAVLLGVMIAVW